VNYYEILELSRTASQDEVKAAYKKMATVVHPDKGGSAMLFRLVQEAYEVLSDPAKRKQHDSDLAGRSGGNRQAETQQHQSQTSSSEANYVRVEDLYKRWKEDRNRVAMPRAESYAAGGVRKLVRKSTFVIVTPDTRLKDVARFGCGNCGHFLIATFTRKVPVQIAMMEKKSEVYAEGQNISFCHKCGQPPGVLRALRWQQNNHLSESIEIDAGDLLFFEDSKLIGARNAFGLVVEGSARNEFGLRSVKVLDEFSGKVISPKFWGMVLGHWKSNDLSKNRTRSMRNWSI
jgi:hypothetical protein